MHYTLSLKTKYVFTPQKLTYLSMFSVNLHTEKNLSSNAARPCKAQWQQWEAALLIDTALNCGVVEAFLPQSGLKIQTIIHGFDLQQSEILLEGFYTTSQIDGTSCIDETGSEIWLQIKAEGMLYLLLTKIKEIEAHFITVSVVDAGMTHNRRWEDRIYFPRLSAPSVTLQIDHTHLSNAQLSNLSVGGAQIIIFGPYSKQTLRKQRELQCHIKFNSELSFMIPANILQWQFFKSPCIHSILRVKFSHPSNAQRTRLSELILAFQSANFQRVA